MVGVSQWVDSDGVDSDGGVSFDSCGLLPREGNFFDRWIVNKCQSLLFSQCSTGLVRHPHDLEVEMRFEPRKSKFETQAVILTFS